jgi:Arc/MetJ-type ribon-helix-helix transcriptional regulator
MKDFTGVKVTSACNNVFPLDYRKSEILKDSNEKTKKMTTVEYIIYWIEGFLDGTLQFNNKSNLIQFTIDRVLEDNKFNNHRETWILESDYASWDWETRTLKDENDRIDFEEKKKRIELIKKQIADALITKKYAKVFRDMKNKKYYLKNNNNVYISNLSQHKYRYVGIYNINLAKQFTGIKKEELKNHFAITRDNFYFEEVTE